MKPTEISIIINRLKVINNSKVDEVGFDEHGKIWVKFINKLNAKYILLMQTLFRFCDGEKILITELDKYKPSDLFKSSQFYDENNYDWKIPSSNKFEAWIDNNKNELLKNLVVENIQINAFGDLQIFFSDDLTLTVYLEVTSTVECWRFFEKDTDEMHDLIVYGSGL